LKILFDQNLSFKLVSLVEDIFPNASHVTLLEMEEADDQEI
jgi:predicted nuclease of predicted toxin-antitoxin system